ETWLRSVASSEKYLAVSLVSATQRGTGEPIMNLLLQEDNSDIFTAFFGDETSFGDLPRWWFEMDFSEEEEDNG
ncbi:unnamed protein product, partial [Amoebophrya sp. A25]